MKSKKSKDYTVIYFLIFLMSGFIINLCSKSPDILKSERRYAAARPQYINEQHSFNPSYAKEFEAYALDQFVWRENLRKMKAYYSYMILRQKDNHGIYYAAGYAAKKEQLNKLSFQKAAQKIQTVKQALPAQMSFYYAVIPEKGYYLSKVSHIPALDYGAVEITMQKNLAGIEEINLRSILTLSDYYHTDLHWRQEKLDEVVQQLGKKMGFISNDMKTYTVNTQAPFYGGYYGQGALPFSGEELVYLTNREQRSVKVSSLNTQTMTMDAGKMYDKQLFYGIDPYDIFLQGAKPLIILENKTLHNGRELYLFRDSYGSSLAPILTPYYQKITMIDLRYITLEYVKEQVNFKQGSDVLFLYGMQILNDSTLLLVNPSVKQ
jgi:hypothetical protein